MKYPIDAVTTETFLGHLVQHDRAQRQLILALTGLLQEAMAEIGDDNEEWLKECRGILKIQKEIKASHETRIFNAKNGYPENHTVKVEANTLVGDIKPIETSVNVPGAQFNPEMNARANDAEKDFGGEMSEEDLARHFREKPKRKKDGEVDMSKKEPFQGMTLDQIEEWEAKQNNSNDIYKIKARVANLAVGISGGSLTPVGEMMVNSFVHVLNDLYKYAEGLTDKEQKIKLIEQIRKHEGMPGNLIAAASAGVRNKK